MADSKTKKERIDETELPPHWQVVRQGGAKPYYWNTVTGKTSWKFPTVDAEAYKSLVNQHCYENVALRARARSVESSPSGTPKLAPKSELTHSASRNSSVDGTELAQYSVVSQDWLQRKKQVASVPPPLPPRDNDLDEDMYDVPVIGKSSEGKTLESFASASSVTVSNDLYQSCAKDESKSAKDETSNEETNDNTGTPTKLHKDLTATRPDINDATYEQIVDISGVQKALAKLPSAAPEYAVVQSSPKRGRPSLNNAVSTSSPSGAAKVEDSSQCYDYIPVSSPTVKLTLAGSEDGKGLYYDLPVTARKFELKSNCPPSPKLANYARLSSSKDENIKELWIPKPPPSQETSSANPKRSISVDRCNSPAADKVDFVDKAIKELKEGLITRDRSPSLDASDFLDLSSNSVVEPPSTEPTGTGGDIVLDWDDSDMQKSPTVQKWIDQHKKAIVQRSYEDVDLKKEQQQEQLLGSNSPSLPDKLKRGWSPRGAQKEGKAVQNLPEGWKTVKGDDGVYYWHVNSGRTQWKPPNEGDANKVSITSMDDDLCELKSTLDDFQSHTLNYAASLISSNDSTDQGDGLVKSKTFAATALGWEEVDDSELVKGQMLNVVLACIRRITTNKGDNLSSATGGLGKEVFLQIHGLELRLLNPESSIVLSTQPINKIRVWGIGVENDRNFGYIARDQSTRRYKCHVFRCQVPAQAVANALLDSHVHCKEKIRYQPGDGTVDYTDQPSVNPNDGGASNEDKEIVKSIAVDDCSDVVAESSVTPALAEPETYQRFECTYLGRVDTKSAYGIDTIVEGLTKLSSNSLKWIDVLVDVAASHIKILSKKNEDLLQEHRVRFLSFLGINPKDEKYCGYVVDTGDSQFMCHGFMMQPNTNKLCIALHGACQARFQRVLDAQPQQSDSPKSERRGTFSFFKRKSKKQPPPSSEKEKKPSDSDPLYKFTVYILGSQPISQSANLDQVKDCVQQLSEKFKLSQVKQATGDFEISSNGLTVTGHQKKLFAKKLYSFKDVTYCVKLKNYFAFVCRESTSKCVCHVFAELEVDAATIVCAIQKTIMPLLARSNT